MTNTQAPLARQSTQTQDIEKLDYDRVSAMTGYSLEQIALIVRTVAKDCPNVELASFLHACNKLGLDPMLKQAYWIRRKNREQVNGEWRDVYRGSLQVGIDGFRSLANRQGNYLSSDAPEFRDWFELKDTKTGEMFQAPGIARVIVRKVVQGHVGSFVGEARWREFYPGDAAGSMWRKMPSLMLAKCAEAQALRKGWPALFGTVEMMADEALAEGSDILEVTSPPPRMAIEEKPAPTAAETAAYRRVYDAEDDNMGGYTGTHQPAPPQRSQPGPQPPEPEPIPEPDGPIDDDGAPDPPDERDDLKVRQDLMVKYGQYLQACKRALGDQLNVEDWTLDDDATIEEIEFSSQGLAELLAQAGEQTKPASTSKVEHLKLNGKLLGQARERGVRQDLRKYTASSGWTQQAIDGANAALKKLVRDADAPADRAVAAGTEHF